MCMMGRDITSTIWVSIILWLILLTKTYYNYNIKTNSQLFLTYTLKPSWHNHYMAVVEQSNAAESVFS